MRLFFLWLTIFPLASAETGSAVCARCHAAIHKEYLKTPMAQSSGPMKRGLVPDPPGAARTLDYFVGSGAVGRSFLFSIDGFLFQSPLSWYSKAARWDVSPGFEKSADALLRAVEPGCLRCHASGLQWKEGTTNGYGTPAFLEGGVACERCHGSGDAHVASGGGSIVNPKKLDTARRDSVCAQCHLSGATEISRGDGAVAFRAGQLLTEKSVTFVWESASSSMPVISHFERMTQSKCRQSSPDRFWCGTCHNPHARTTEYRQKCLDCHADKGCTESVAARSAVGDDCISCHMPKTAAESVQHAAFTDHSVPRRPRTGGSADVPKDATLRAFGGTAATDRELGLAYADVALRSNNRAWGMRAFGLLQAEYKRNPEDVKTAAQLAQLYDRMGQESRACELYAGVVASTPNAIAPAINLGSCLAKQGRLEESMRLWAGVLERSPGQEGARLNLAVAQWQTGEKAKARATVAEALRWNPGSRRAREMLKQFAGE